MKSNNKIDFFVVGSARCGTTTLYNYLNNNNNIFLPKVKEPNFFSNVESPKSEDYDPPLPNKKYHSKIISSQEVYDTLYTDALESQIKGDVSPSYLWDTNTAKKIYKHNPEAKIIISLRHPIDRAYSHYIMNYYTGVDTSKSFNEALESKKNELWGSCNQYLEMSAYYNQVKEYFMLFPKEKIKILVYEDWTKDIRTEVNNLFQFLNVEVCETIYNKEVENNKITPVKKIYILNFLRQNKIKAFIKKLVNQERVDSLKAYFFNDNKEIKKIDEKLRKKLSKKFKEEIKQLSELTEIDFNEKWF